MVVPVDLEWWNECFDRGSEFSFFESLSPLFYVLSILAIMLSGCCLSCFRAVHCGERKNLVCAPSPAPPLTQTFILALAQFLVCYGFVLMSNEFVTYGKRLLGDTRCSTNPNGISGHVNFYSLSLAFLLLIATPQPFGQVKRFGRTVRYVVACTVPLSVVIASSMIVLSETYLGGYHTPQQMTLGLTSAVGLFLFFRITVYPWMSPARPVSHHWAAPTFVAALAVTGAYLCGDVSAEATVMPIVLLMVSIILFTLRYWVQVAPGAISTGFRKLKKWSEDQPNTTPDGTDDQTPRDPPMDADLDAGIENMRQFLASLTSDRQAPEEEVNENGRPSW